MKKMRPHKKGFEPVVGVGCPVAEKRDPCDADRTAGQ